MPNYITYDDLKEFLRENLTIDIDWDSGFYSADTYEVKLRLCGEEISRSSVEVRCERR